MALKWSWSPERRGGWCMDVGVAVAVVVKCRRSMNMGDPISGARG